MDGGVYEIASRPRKQAGSVQQQEWFKPVTRPFLNDSFRAPTPSGSRLSFGIRGFGGGDHVGRSMDNLRRKETLTLYQGSARLAQGTATAPPVDPRLYRMVVDTTRDACDAGRRPGRAAAAPARLGAGHRPGGPRRACRTCCPRSRPSAVRAVPPRPRIATSPRKWPYGWLAGWPLCSGAVGAALRSMAFVIDAVSLALARSGVSDEQADNSVPLRP